MNWPDAHPALTEDTVRAMLAAQHPDLAELTIGERFDGWDMAMFRLGEDLALRMPRTTQALGSLEAEARWLEPLSEHWTFPLPRVVRRGEPQFDYPWPWSIVSWLPGDLAVTSPLTISGGIAIGAALAQVHTPAPADAPVNDEQSISIAERAERAEAMISTLAHATGPQGDRLDAQAAHAIWDQAMAAPAPTEVVWSHADLHGYNVISNNGELGGIIDWGDMAACDRAVDLGFLFTLMPADAVEAAWNEYARLTGKLDDAVKSRARGIGLFMGMGLALWETPATSAMGLRAMKALGITR
jgi:aminoglycoside phosphotransferase (APT) family kinase protein